MIDVDLAAERLAHAINNHCFVVAETFEHELQARLTDQTNAKHSYSLKALQKTIEGVLEEIGS